MSLAFSIFPCIPFEIQSYKYDILMWLVWFVFYLVKPRQTTLIVHVGGGWFIFLLMFVI